MKTSDTISELSAALALAALEFPKIERTRTATVYPKDKEKKPYHYDYADLDDVLSAVRSPLAKNGLVISHDCKVIYQPSFCVEVTARLDHSSGQWKESEPLPMPCEGTMSGAQQIGSASTYGKRYTSQNILGISTDADDDGNAAANHDAATEPRKKAPACPKCHKTGCVIEGKAEFDTAGRWVCWKKKEGCGWTWEINPGAATEQGVSADIFNKARGAINLCNICGDIDGIVDDAIESNLLSDQQSGQLRTFAQARKIILEPTPEKKKKRTPAQMKNDYIAKVALLGMNLKDLLPMREWLTIDAEGAGFTADMILECSEAIEPAISKAEAYQADPVHA